MVCSCKDAEGKKKDAVSSSKEPSNAAPLQTASVSVRALIEEKIIQKRNTIIQGELNLVCIFPFDHHQHHYLLVCKIHSVCTDYIHPMTFDDDWTSWI